MSRTHDQSLFEALLDSWDRNNTILLNLLRALPEVGLEARVMGDSPSVAELFAHIHYVRLVFLSEDAPEFARDLPKDNDEWMDERDPDRLAQMLNHSAQAVRDAVKSRIPPSLPLRSRLDIARVTGLKRYTCPATAMTFCRSASVARAAALASSVASGFSTSSGLRAARIRRATA